MSKAPDTIYIDPSFDGSSGTYAKERLHDSDIAYDHGSIAYGYAREVERLKAELLDLCKCGDDVATRLVRSCIENQAFRSALTQISRNASVMTAHQIEQIAASALEGGK